MILHMLKAVTVVAIATQTDQKVIVVRDSMNDPSGANMKIRASGTMSFFLTFPLCDLFFNLNGWRRNRIAELH